MKLPPILGVAGILATFTFSPSFQLQAQDVSASTVPAGFVTWEIAGSGGSGRALTPLALPLVDPAAGLTGSASGRLSAVGSNSIGDSSGGWAAGELADASAPVCVRITSGAAEGRTFLVSANTSDTITVDSGSLDLTTLGIATGSGGDTYELLNCDTIGGLFGTPATTGILGGATADSADNLQVFLQGAWQTFYFDTGKGHWVKRAFGTPDSSDVPILPDAGILYSRLGSDSLEIVLLGRVPSSDRQVVINASGLTALGSSWPVEIELKDSGIQDIGGWVSSADVNQADTVKLFQNGVWNEYWFDGTNWKKRSFGSPVSDSEKIAPGSVVLISKRTPTSSDETLSQEVPYSL
jgi:uncharacterized protein (TIGR02597 family)